MDNYYVRTTYTSYSTYSTTTEDLDSTHNFERERIRALQEERLHIQKKTFTKWINSFLQKARLEVEDLFTDLADGRNLLKLLEIISGEKLGKPNAGKMRVHKIENVNRSLAFLHTKVRLESIGAEDIVDGNPRLILGLIWTIILRFQIQEIEINVDDQEQNGEKRSAKDALLLWCQRRTQDYRNVAIRDFTSSWRDGLGFNALIHSQRPELVDFDNLDPDDHIGNLESAFELAEKNFGVPKLLDPEDVDITKPDEKSVLTYVASFYHTFSRLKEGHRGGKRIGNIVSKIRDVEDQQLQFEKLIALLLEWILAKTVEMKDRTFSNSLEGIQSDLKKFKNYVHFEKPPKCKEKVNIEATYFEFQTKLKQLNQPPYTGARLAEQEQAWNNLEREEHLKEVAIKKEIIRQEKLKQLESKFNRKSTLRDGYLEEMIQVLTDPRYGSNLQRADASLKKHEAIAADIMSREDRFHDLEEMAHELIEQNYCHKVQVAAKAKYIMDKWDALTRLLEMHRIKLERHNALRIFIRDLNSMHAAVKRLKASFNLVIEDVNFPEAIQKLHLLESELNVLSDSVNKIRSQAKQYDENYTGKTDENDDELFQTLRLNLKVLNEDYESLLEESRAKRKEFEDYQVLYKIKNDLEDVRQWLNDKIALYSSTVVARDQRALQLMQDKHKVFQNEMERWYVKYETSAAMTKNLTAAQKKDSTNFEVEKKISGLKKQWETLRSLVEIRDSKMANLSEILTFLSDCNDADSWLKEMLSLVSSSDYGTDEFTSMALLNRHKEIQQRVLSFEPDVKKIISSGKRITDLANPDNNNEDEDEKERKQETTIVYEERLVPQVKVLYPYSGHGVQVVKGELLFLLNKSNNDWWNIRKADGKDGFVPRNYVKEQEPKRVRVEVVKSVARKGGASSSSSSSLPKITKESLKDRVDKINEEYDKVVTQTEKRKGYLMRAIKSFNFSSKCDDATAWIKEKQRILQRPLNKTGSSSSSSSSSSSLSSNNNNNVRDVLHSIVRFGDRIEEISHLSDELMKELLPSELGFVKRKTNEVMNQWEELNKTKDSQQKILEGSMQVDSFYKSVDEASDWVQEKDEILSGLLEKSPTSPSQHQDQKQIVDNMQRRHRAFERELIPIQDKVRYISHHAAAQVKKAFPREASNINRRVEELNVKFRNLNARASKRRDQLDRQLSAERFANESKDCRKWAEDTLQALKDSDDVAKIKDSKMAEDLLRAHYELKDEIQSKNDAFKEVVLLGTQLQEPSASELAELKRRIQEEWERREGDLKRAKELQQLHKEYDIIDSYITAQLRQNPVTEVTTQDELDSAIKRETELTNALEVHSARLAVFQESSNKLSEPDIAKKRSKLGNKWSELTSHRMVVKKDLENTKEYLDFTVAVDNMNNFIAEKSKIAKDTTFRDGANLKTKVKRHEVFEGELKANASQVKLLNMMGHKLRDQGHPRSGDIESILTNLNSNWDSLLDETKTKNRFLKQAVASNEYKSMVSDIRRKQDGIADALTDSENEPVQDRRHCRQLISKHQNLENEFKLVNQRISALEDQARLLTSNTEGHFDADKILNAVKECKASMEDLKPRIENRSKELQRALKYQEFKFEFNSELQWIQEKKTLANAAIPGKSLQQVNSFAKRQRNLEEELASHYPSIEKLYATGKTFGENCAEVKSELANLEKIMKSKSDDVNIAQRYQTYFFEVNEIENWIELKNSILKTEDYGKDEDSTVKLLTKQKALELEIDSYTGIINELKNEAAKLSVLNDPQAKLVKNKDDLLSQEIKALHRRFKAHRSKLVARLQYHEYMRESEDLEHWIKEKMVTAGSQELGQDYEHLELLTNKYDNFKRNVLAGNEKFKAVTALAKRLGQESEYDNNEVAEVQKKLTKDWEALLAAIEVRDKKLEAAGEIHRYNRDAAEALNRIQEKYSSLDLDDLGKDVKSVQRLLRGHEVFENDLVALEAQLQVLIDDSAILRTKYPGPNAQHIADQQKIVVKNWEALQSKAKDRKAALRANYEYQSFLKMSNDLSTWAGHLKTGLLTEERVHDVAAAQLLKTEHDNQKAEIESREPTFREIVQSGEAMQNRGHAASEDVKNKLEQVLQERQNLHMAWQQKKVYLDQLCDLQFFLRDSRNILTFLSAQEHSLNKDLTSLVTLVEVDKELKQHETFLNLMNGYDDKTKNLKSHSKKLIDQDHFDSATIAAKMKEVEKFNAHVNELARDKAQRLQIQKLYIEFNRDVSEMEDWIEEKRRKFTDDSKTYEAASLDQKIKFLKRYQVFENEITQNKNLMDKVLSAGESLLETKHRNGNEIREKIEKLKLDWNSLNQLSDEIRKDLQDALDMHNFNMSADKIEAWIRDKELMIIASELGKDFEHCKELERKLNDADSDMKVDDDKMKNMKSLASRITESNPLNSEEVILRFDSLIDKWKRLQSSLMEYRSKLNFASKVHKFHSDVDDLYEMISEKSKQIDTAVASVKTLDDAKKDMKKSTTTLDFFKSLDARLTELSEKGRELRDDDSELSQNANAKLEKVYNLRADSMEACREHMLKVDKLIEFYTFIGAVKRQKTQLEDLAMKMTLEGTPVTEAEVDAALNQHEEKKSLLLAPKDNIAALEDQSVIIMDLLPKETSNLENQLADLNRKYAEAEAEWHKTKTRLEQCHSLNVFTTKTSEINSWIENKEAFLESKDHLGDSIVDVEALIRKHDTFERSLTQQIQQGYGSLVAESESLLKDGHFAENTIEAKMETIRNRLKILKDKSLDRGRDLEQSKRCHLLLRKIYEMKSWTKEKLQIALDETYLDLTNILSKIQRHSAFESEIMANSGRLEDLKDEAKPLVKSSSSPVVREVQTQLKDLSTEWAHLLDTLKMKKQRLEQANEANVHINLLKDIECFEVETTEMLQAEDYGRDLNAVKALLKKQAAIESHLGDACSKLSEMKEKCSAKFESENHFMLTDLKTQTDSVVQRYANLHEPLQRRRENLEDSLIFYELQRDVQDELFWLEEKSVLAASTDYGSSLVAVESMVKKHQLLETDISNHENIIRSLIEKGEQMIRSQHRSSHQISSIIGDLNSKIGKLKDHSAIRKLRLEDALHSQHFYIQCAEISALIAEKELFLSKSKDYVEDEDGIHTYLKRFDALESELDRHVPQVNALVEKADGLLKRQHFDSAVIETKMTEVRDGFGALRDAVKYQRRHLMAKQKVMTFLRESDEMTEWINAQLAVAASEEYGKDLFHVEVLIQKFDTFLKSLEGHKNKVAELDDSSKSLLSADDGIDGTEITKRMKEIHSQWEDLNELALARQEALFGAKRVHGFDKTVDETLEWINEKDAILAVDDTCQDIETAHALLQRQEGLHRDLAAIQDQVKEIDKEAKSLCVSYPDAAEHINVKNDELKAAIEALVSKAQTRDEQLKQNEKLLDYYGDYRELMSWTTEIMSKVTGPELGRNLQEAEFLMIRHDQYLTEIQSRNEEFDNFDRTGTTLVDHGHFMSDDIRERIAALQSRKQTLDQCWTLRSRIYTQHLDYLKWLKNIHDLESWLGARESEIANEAFGDSIEDVEQLLSKQTEIEKSMFNKDQHLEAVKRLTLIETDFAQLKEKEEAARKEDESRREAERIQAIKKKEMARISRERKREDERRRTQEIVFTFNPNSANGTNETMEQTIVPSTMAESITRSKSTLPSFNTRRSFRQSVRKRDHLPVKELPPVDMEGFLERKQELQAGGRRATIRSWKMFYTVLCGQLVCFFRDQQDFHESKPAASPPILLQRALCSPATDYTKKKHVFRVTLSDSSEFLFATGSDENLSVWVDKFIEMSLREGTTPPLPEPSPPEPVYANTMPITATVSPPSPVSYGSMVVHEESSFEDDTDSHNKEKKSRLARFLGIKS